MSKPARRKLIVVLGPTSSGKSDLAVAVARKWNGEVVSADSRQVYRGMNLGTGKVPRDLPAQAGKRKKKKGKRTPLYNSMELYSGYFHGGVRHHLLNVASPKRVFTAEEYKRKARKAIYDIWKRGKLPILCGGTGFYIDAVVYGTEFPNVPPSLRLRKTMEKKTTEALFEKLLHLDPDRANSIDPKNRHRVMRSLEIAHALGKVPKIKASPLPADILFIGIRKDPEELKKLIRARLEKRLKKGMLKEIENLHKSGVSWKRLDSFGLEYKWGAQFFKKNKDICYPYIKVVFVEGLVKDSIRYAKRQMTWFKRNPKIHWIKNEREALKLAKDFLRIDEPVTLS